MRIEEENNPRAPVDALRDASTTRTRGRVSFNALHLPPSDTTWPLPSLAFTILRMPARPALTLEAIPESVPKIFEQAQVSAANHQKNYVALNKIHKDASSITKVTDDGEGLQLIGEKAFEDIFINMLLRVLPIKKGANVVDRVIRFVSGYVKFISDKSECFYVSSAAEGLIVSLVSKEANEGEVLEEDTAANRFIERLVKYLLKGFEGKDKNVRFRVLQLVAELVPSMANIECV